MRLEFQTVGTVSEAQFVSNAAVNTASGYPMLESTGPHEVPLAIVGGGPSAGRYLDELVNFPGHIWAINQGASWLSKYRKKDVWMFTVDPEEVMAEPQWTDGVERAILGSSCSPKLFEVLKGKDVRMFHTHDADGNDSLQLNIGGPSSATRVFLPALWLGYVDVTFYGCEGSFETPEKTHAYRVEEKAKQMLVKCGESVFLTSVDLYLTTKYLAGVLKEFPGSLKEKSGGLLRGMLEHWDTWEVVAYSKALRDQIDPTAVKPYILEH